MGLLKSFFSQCARPEGALGRVMLSFMNYTHAPLTKWGLRLVDVKDGWTMLDRQSMQASLPSLNRSLGLYMEWLTPRSA